jgi:Fur family transcriptional regulator, peroxide stress response regulator
LSVEPIKYRPEELKQKLSEAGLKATSQRIAIYDALLRLGDHPKAEQVYEQVHQQHPSLSLGTVYKTLDTLVKAGLIRKVFTQEDCMRYDADTSSHNHIYCTNTGEIVDYYDEELETLIKDFLAKKNIRNLSIQDIRLHINGEKDNPAEEISIN